MFSAQDLDRLLDRFLEEANLRQKSVKRQKPGSSTGSPKKLRVFSKPPHPKKFGWFLKPPHPTPKKFGVVYNPVLDCLVICLHFELQKTCLKACLCRQAAS